jgi:hypothetical protein
VIAEGAGHIRVGATAFTVCITALDVTEADDELPDQVAVILWLPAASAFVEIVAELFSIVPVPMGIPESAKVIVPVGPVESIAVNFTLVP